MSLKTNVYLWYLNYKRWCDAREFDPETYAEWLDKTLTSKLLWAD